MSPFAPESTEHLKAGHFWAIPITGSQQFGCGVVVALEVSASGQRDPQLFVAGLLDWIGEAPPDAGSIAGRPLVRCYNVHIKTILISGGELIGEVTPWWEWPAEMSEADCERFRTAGYMVLSLLAKSLASAAS